METFEQRFWSPLQALAWAMLGDRKLVMEFGQNGSELDLHNYFFLDLVIKKEYRSSYYPNLTPYYTSPEEAEAVLIDALQHGSTQALGLRNGFGDLEPIPIDAWADLAFYHSEGFCKKTNCHGRDMYAGPRDRSRFEATHWHGIQIRREGVMDLWPDRLADLVESGASAPDLPYQGPKASDETNCRVWLERLMRSETKAAPKENYQNKAKEKFGVGVRAFNRSWAQAVENTGADNWQRGGRPINQNTNNPNTKP